jgi:hypothetical protein
MATKFSTALRNSMLDAIESAIGTSAVLQIKTGSAPAGVSSANSGSILCTYSLASDWAAAAGSGAKNFNNLPLTTSALTSGTAGHFRIFSSTGVCHWQGSVTATGGGGDMTIDNTSIANNQTIQVTSFTLTAGNS